MRLKVANPFDFWPDEMIIETDQVHVVYKQMLSKQERTMLIKDISDISIEKIPFFATLRIIDVNFQDKPVVLKFLNKDDANNARWIIQGLRTSLDMGIDYTQFNAKELRDKMIEIAKMRKT